MAGGTTAPHGIDTTVPTTARMCDYWLGSHDNFAVDRAAALAVSEAVPDVQLTAVENRRFQRRAVRCLAGRQVSRQQSSAGPHRVAEQPMRD